MGIAPSASQDVRSPESLVSYNTRRTNGHRLEPSQPILVWYILTLLLCPCLSTFSLPLAQFVDVHFTVYSKSTVHHRLRIRHHLHEKLVYSWHSLTSIGPDAIGSVI